MLVQKPLMKALRRNQTSLGSNNTTSSSSLPSTSSSSSSWIHLRSVLFIVASSSSSSSSPVSSDRLVLFLSTSLLLQTLRLFDPLFFNSLTKDFYFPLFLLPPLS